MKYIEVEVEGALEQGGLRLKGGTEGIEARPSQAISDRASDVTDQRSPIRSSERSSMPKS